MQNKSFNLRASLAIALILVLSMCFSACADILGTPDAFLPDNDLDPGTSLGTFSPDQSQGYYYQQLTPQEKNIYDDLLKKIRNGGNTCTFTNGTYADFSTWVKRAVYAIHYEHPELFWIACGYSFSFSQGFLDSPSSCKVTVKEYDFWKYVSNKKKYIDRLNAEVDKVAALANQCKTDYEKVQFVHDYIALNAFYDFDGLAEAKKTMADENSFYIYTAYGCLVNGKTVCSGYAKAFQLIMTKLGFNCIYYTGHAGGPHGWNCIYLDDQAYWVDITWDDPTHEDSNGNLMYPNEASYEYFCINTNELSGTHVPDDLFKAPVCVSSDFGFHEHNGYILDTYDFEKAKQILLQQDGKISSIKFSNDAAMNEAYTELVSNSKIHKIFSGKVSVSCSIPHRIITFYQK